MLGIIYLLLCFTMGCILCSFVFPGINEIGKTTFRKAPISLPGIFIKLPVWFITGTLLMSWLTYLTAYLFRGMSRPLSYANGIVMPVMVILSGAGLFYLYRKNKRNNVSLSAKKMLTSLKNSFTIGELIFLLLVLVLAIQLMWHTFYINDDELGVGLSVFSDFAPHLGMIRSFSYGNNFPTEYAHFAGEDIKYHFMFQFLVGNLEFLGLRLDFAFNIPSMLSFAGVFLLLYVVAVKVTGKKAAGFLAGMLFAFRSSPSLFVAIKDYMSEGDSFGQAIRLLVDNNSFIGKTPNENWGLWNLNVYCNQRHLAFSLMILLFVLLLFLPLFYEQVARISSLLREKSAEMKKRNSNETIFQKAGMRITLWFRAAFFSKEGWVVRDIRLAVFGGILLGATAFFNGAVLIAALTILFLLAACSDRRLEYLIMALIAGGLSLLQSALFIEGSAVSPNFFFGFIAEEKTITGVISYIIQLAGILPFVLLTAFLCIKGAERYLMTAFCLPFVMAFTVSLTPDVTVNHKNIMLSFMLLGIFAADLIVRLFQKKNLLLRTLSVLLVVLLTITGIYDYRTVIVRNAKENNMYFNLKDPLLLWIKENSDSHDIFLTANYYLNNMVLGGAMLYYGWPYYAWSAGYDTDYRAMMTKLMYEAETPEELYELAEQENIRYIIVDYENRVSEDYMLNEWNIEAAYEKIYEQGSGNTMVSIYDTTKKLQDENE